MLITKHLLTCPLARGVLKAAAVLALIFLAASVLGKEVGSVRSLTGSSIHLYDDTVGCTDGTQVVVARPTHRPPFVGCWHEKAGTIWIEWSDGEVSAYDRKLFSFEGV